MNSKKIKLMIKIRKVLNKDPYSQLEQVNYSEEETQKEIV